MCCDVHSCVCVRIVESIASISQSCHVKVHMCLSPSPPTDTSNTAVIIGVVVAVVIVIFLLILVIFVIVFLYMRRKDISESQS